MNRTDEIVHQRTRLVFSTPNSQSQWRARTFSTKEPETLDWIDSIEESSVLWDVGANVGLYSCYAAKHRNCRVFAFEPSVFNLELLARNTFLNALTGRVTIVPLPLSGTRAVNTLNMITTDWGGALSTFGESFGYDGKPMKKVFEFSTIGITMVDAVLVLGIPQPDYVKMDVDGIEHLILAGGQEVLRKARGVLVEINDHFEVQAENASRYLREAGLTMTDKKHAAYFDAVGEDVGKYTFNQIWTRKQPRMDA